MNTKNAETLFEMWKLDMLDQFPMQYSDPTYFEFARSRLVILPDRPEMPAVIDIPEEGVGILLGTTDPLQYRRP